MIKRALCLSLSPVPVECAVGRSVGRASERTSERRTNERQTNERTAGRERKEQISAREKVRAITKRYREQRDSSSLHSRYDGCREREIRSAGLSVLRTDEICQCLVVTIGFCSRKSSSRLNSRRLNCAGESFHPISFTKKIDVYIRAIVIETTILMYIYRAYVSMHADARTYTHVPKYIVYSYTLCSCLI